MSQEANVFPPKIFDIHNVLMDTTRWSRVNLREGDVVIATYAKSGTTWLQQIVGQILSQGDPTIAVARHSPWIELRLLPPPAYDALEKQQGRRFMKTHGVPGAIPYAPQAKYIYIGRDGRDVCWSLHNHYSNFTDEFLSEINGLPNRQGPPLARGIEDAHDFYKNWIIYDGSPTWAFWPHIRAWWQVRNVANVKLIHFNALKSDLAGSVRAIAKFLDAEMPDEKMPSILNHCSFEYMKAHAAEVAPRGGINWKGGAATFINKGSNGRWKDVLSFQECAEYEARATQELGQDCATWLKGEV